MYVEAHYRCDTCDRWVASQDDLKMVPTSDAVLTAMICEVCVKAYGWTDEKRIAALDAQYEALFGRKPDSPHK